MQEGKSVVIQAPPAVATASAPSPHPLVAITVPAATATASAPPPVIQRVGPAFALIVPTKYVIETQPPESGLHPHGDYDHSAVVIGTEVVLLLVVVFVIVADKVVAWVVRTPNGKTTPGGKPA
jgi:hypothetical protein